MTIYRLQEIDGEQCKNCTKCGDVFPLTAEFWDRNIHHSTGFAGECKACRAEYKRARQAVYTKQAKLRYQNFRAMRDMLLRLEKIIRDAANGGHLPAHLLQELEEAGWTR